MIYRKPQCYNPNSALFAHRQDVNKNISLGCNKIPDISMVFPCPFLPECAWDSSIYRGNLKSHLQIEHAGSHLPTIWSNHSGGLAPKAQINGVNLHRKFQIQCTQRKIYSCPNMGTLAKKSATWGLDDQGAADDMVLSTRIPNIQYGNNSATCPYCKKSIQSFALCR